METRKCKDCKTEYPKTVEYFYKYKSKNGKRYFQNRCKSCQKKLSVKYMQSPNGLEIHKRYRNKHPDRVKQQCDNWQNKVSGVYGIFSEGICLYVGESKRVNGRISDHKHRISNPLSKTRQKELYENLRQYDHLIFGILEETDNHLEREKYYINKFKPLYNA